MLLGGVPMSFAEMVKAHRYKKKMTLSELAEKTGINRSVLSRIETGETKRPGFSKCQKIATVLHIPHERIISFYLDISERADMIKRLLKEAIACSDRYIVRKAANKLLETPKMNTFLALDHLFQVAKASDAEEIKLTLYDVMIAYTKKRGIPFYLAKALFERYLIERYDFFRMEESYRRGKDLLVYMEYLQPAERIEAYYRLGLQAYALKYFDECISLCKEAVEKDSSENELQSSALLAITNAYINLGDCILAELYLKKYEKHPYSQANRARYLRAQLYVKNSEFDKAIVELKACLADSAHDGRIAIAVDLLEVYLQTGDSDGVNELVKQEGEFMPKVLNTPKKLEHVALYYKLKGMHELACKQIDEGLESLTKSISFYRQLGAHAEIHECSGIVQGFLLGSLSFHEKLFLLKSV
jgi:transcriptional regulator with XRE-family HTH domain